MDDKMSEGMSSNMLTYMRDIDRITRKYSQHQDDVNVIDLNETSRKVCCRRIRKTEGQLKMSLTNTSIDFGEESLRAQDTSYTQQWDNTLQEDEADQTDLGGNHSVQHEVTGVSGMNNTQLSQSFLDETRGSQPEDQDEELEKTLSSHGTSLVELYPRMIDKLSKAVYSQQVFDAADAVLRKYRRQRFQPNASRLNHTLDVSVRAPDHRNPKKNGVKVVRKRPPDCSLLMNITREVVNQSYLHDVTNQQEIGRHKKKADPVESKYRPDVLIHPSFVTKIVQRQQHLAPTESPHQRDQPTGRSGRLTIDGFRSQSPRSGREVIHPLPTCNAAHEKESFTVSDGSAVFSSPVRRSPFKTWLKNLESQSGMSHALSQRPKSDTAGSPSRHLAEWRSRSASPFASPQKCPKHSGESRSRSTAPFASPQRHSKHPGESRSTALLSFTVPDSAAAFSPPVRQSPFKTWLKNVERQSGMSHALSQRPKSDTAGSPSRHLAESRSRSTSPFASLQKYSKHPGESRSRSASPLSSPQKSIMSTTKHHYYSPSQPKVNLCQSPSTIHSSLQKLTMSPMKHHHCSDSPSQPKIYSHHSTTGTERSLDISTCHDNSSSNRYSPKKIDMEFQRVYHRCVCLGKPVPLGPLCSMCTMHMDGNNRAMSALALSPHRSLLRKRHRELDSESSHSSKRFRGRCDVNSPGSHRHLKKNYKSSSIRRLLYSTGPEASTD